MSPSQIKVARIGHGVAVDGVPVVRLALALGILGPQQFGDGGEAGIVAVLEIRRLSAAWSIAACAVSSESSAVSRWMCAWLTSSRMLLRYAATCASMRCLAALSRAS